MRHYSHIHDGDEDAGYYYNERANISFLAAGAWLSGGAALEEYVSSKYKSTAKSNGRVDLYICTKNKKSIEIEAKHKWLKADFNGTRLKRHVLERLTMARDDVRALEGSWYRYACVFYVSQFRQNHFENYSENSAFHIRQHIEETIACARGCLWAWSFPSQTRFIEDNKCYYPGVIMCLAPV